MKKLYVPLLLLFIVIAALTEQGCDILNNLFLNMPIKESLEYSGSDTQIYIQKHFCLDDYDEFDDNIDNIEAVKYVGALYRTDSCSAGLHGNAVLRLLKNDGVSEIWNVKIASWNAGDYTKDKGVFEIHLEPAEIDSFNVYVSNFANNVCFYAELLVTDVGADNDPPYDLYGKVELVVELDIKP